MVGFGCGEELGGAAEWVRDFAGCRGLRVLLGFELGGGEDEASAYGVEDVLRDERACGVEGGEAHAVGVCCDCGVGVHLVAVKEKVFGFCEGDGVAIEEIEKVCGADGG